MMRTTIHFRWTPVILISLFCSLSFVGCIDEDLNNNPNTSSDIQPDLLLTSVQLLPSNDAEEWHRYFIYPGGFMNHWACDWATVAYGSAGVKSDAYFAQMWTSYYLSTIVYLVDMLEKTRDLPAYTTLHAMGRVLKVENFLRLTDYYGDVPYSEAGKGYQNHIFKPAYDKQEDIYTDFFLQLDEAEKVFAEQTASTINGDLYYGGNIEKWRKYANSLRLRIAMRLVKVDPERARREVEKAVKQGVFTSNDDICFIAHDDIQTTSPSGGNGIANRLLTNNRSSTFRITTELIGAMETTGDPRVCYMGGSYLEDLSRTDITGQLLEYYGSYSRFTLGAQLYSYSQEAQIKQTIRIIVDGTETEVPALLQYMQPSKYITNPASPSIRMSYAEVEYLLAEAAYRGFNTGGTAEAHFEKGLRAAVEQWTLFGVKVNEADTEEFVKNNPLQTGQEANQINTQLWILHFLDPLEAWANWRRTGLPDIQFYNYQPSVNQSDKQTPRRMQYPLSEQTLNRDNYQTAISRMGDDDWLNRVWWDKEQ